MILLLNIVTTVCIGLLIGTEFAVSAFINPVLSKLDNHAQANAIRMFARRLGAAMPFWYGSSLLLLIIETIVRRYGPGDLLLITACAIWIAVVIHTILVLVPINNRMIRMDASGFSPDAKREHDKWDSLHRLRVAALASSMVCFLVVVCR